MTCPPAYLDEELVALQVAEPGDPARPRILAVLLVRSHEDSAHLDVLCCFCVKANLTLHVWHSICIL